MQISLISSWSSKNLTSSYILRYHVSVAVVIEMKYVHGRKFRDVAQAVIPTVILEELQNAKMSMWRC